jgi:DNA-binding MarR family transcriptional regulator
MLHLPAQTITSVLDRLQAAGLVSRSAHPSDRRSTIAELTPAGGQAIYQICRRTHIGQFWSLSHAVHVVWARRAYSTSRLARWAACEACVGHSAASQ